MGVRGHPKPRLSRNSLGKAAAYTMSFFGTHPRSTHVPPAPPTVSLLTNPNGSSHIATFAPAPPIPGCTVAHGRQLIAFI